MPFFVCIKEIIFENVVFNVLCDRLVCNDRSSKGIFNLNLTTTTRSNFLMASFFAFIMCVKSRLVREKKETPVINLAASSLSLMANGS